MNATPPDNLQADRAVRDSRSSPLESSAPTDRLRGRLIVIGFVAAAPIALGGWLWLLGRIAFAMM